MIHKRFTHIPFYELPSNVLMAYRFAAFASLANGADDPFKLTFDTEKRLLEFVAKFPELVDYIEDIPDGNTA